MIKSSGIVRRIDDLGRIVIPKEIRRALNIEDGDPMEVFTVKDDKNEFYVAFKKFVPVGIKEAYEQMMKNINYLKESGLDVSELETKAYEFYKESIE